MNCINLKDECGCGDRHCHDKQKEILPETQRGKMNIVCVSKSIYGANECISMGECVCVCLHV